MLRAADYYPPGINCYVPGMQYDVNQHLGPISEYSLGTPDAEDDDGVHADLDADLTLTTVGTTGVIYTMVPGSGGNGATSDAEYGQAILLSISGDPGATGYSVRAHGEDYLGQPMAETITVGNGITADVYGTKAFKRITKLVPLVAATNSVTCDVGWAARFGVPYKVGQFIGGSEGGVDALPGLGMITDVANVVVSSTNAASFVAPVDGYIVGVRAEVTVAVTSDFAVMDAVVGGSGVAALDFTIPVSGIGTVAGNVLDPSAWVAVSRGDTVVWTSDGDPAAGAADVEVIFSEGVVPVMVGPDTTDPATATTNDPRGLYIPSIAPDGTKEYKVRYIPNSDVNASENGGLHGIAHYNV